MPLGRRGRALAAAVAALTALAGCGGGGGGGAARTNAESPVTMPPRGGPSRVDPGRRAVMQGIRKQTAFLHEETPVARSLRGAISARVPAGAVDGVLLVKWVPAPDSSFTGTLSPREDALVDFTFRWDPTAATGSISVWQPAAIDGPDRVTQRDAVDELRGYANEGPDSRESRLSGAETQLGYRFPADYRAYMLVHDGSIGQARSGEYLDLTPIYDLVDVNDTPMRATHAGLVLIGSDGDHRLLGFDTRADPAAIVLLRTSSAGWGDVVVQGQSFDQFIQAVDQTGFRA